MSLVDPPRHARIKFGWPQTLWGHTVLWATVLYVVIWLLFWISPDAKAALLGASYLGPAVSWFTAIYIYVLIAHLVWWFIWDHVLS